MEESQRLRQLRWMCRRGMRELDVLLEAFVNKQAGPLAANAWPEFEALLRCEDDRIWDWLQDPAQVLTLPDAKDFGPILLEIRGGLSRLD